jgi:hypothetical protein
MDADQHIGEPGLGIDVVQPRGLNNTIFDKGIDSLTRHSPALLPPVEEFQQLVTCSLIYIKANLLTREPGSEITNDAKAAPCALPNDLPSAVVPRTTRM